MTNTEKLDSIRAECRKLFASDNHIKDDYVEFYLNRQLSLQNVPVYIEKSKLQSQQQYYNIIVEDTNFVLKELPGEHRVHGYCKRHKLALIKENETNERR